MNKTFFFLAIIAIFLATLTSCDSGLSGPGVSKVVRENIPYFDEDPILGQRTGCAGQRLDQPKVIGWNSFIDTITRSNIWIFTDKELSDAGYVYKPSRQTDDVVTNTLSDAGNGFYNSNLDPWLKWLLILLLLVILFLALREAMRGNSNNPNTTTAQPAPPPTPPADPPTPPKNQANNLSATDMSEMMKTLGRNGGSLDTRADGSFHATFNPAREEKEPVKSPEVQEGKVAPVEKTEETKPAQ